MDFDNRKERLGAGDDSSLDLAEGANFAAGTEAEETVTEDKNLLRNLEEDIRLRLRIRSEDMAAMIDSGSHSHRYAVGRRSPAVQGTTTWLRRRFCDQERQCTDAED